LIRLKLDREDLSNQVGDLSNQVAELTKQLDQAKMDSSKLAQQVEDSQSSQAKNRLSIEHFKPLTATTHLIKVFIHHHHHSYILSS
jgi:septal ring factor EnvC (AmiA/AmiB activator)